MAETAAARKKREAAEAQAAAVEGVEAVHEEVAAAMPDEPREQQVEPQKNIVQLISLISKEAGALAPESKGGVPFPFRGVDGTVNHIAPKLWKYGVIVVPEVLECVVTPNAQGNRTVKTSEVLTKFHFYAPDMTSITATTAGLADDFGDRSTAQAQSVAYRIALLQTFSLPTQQPEPEETGQVVQDGAAAPAAAPPQQPRAAATVANARQASPAQTAQATAGNPSVIITQIKTAAGMRGLGGAQINAYGQELSNGNADWLNDPAVLNKVLETIQKLPLKE